MTQYQSALRTTEERYLTYITDALKPVLHTVDSEQIKRHVAFLKSWVENQSCWRPPPALENQDTMMCLGRECQLKDLANTI
jgi:hypothetical protein